MARRQPNVRITETYTESNFIRLHTSACAADPEPLRSVTIEHLRYEPSAGDTPGWRCATIVDREAMSREDALFIADAYAREHGVPVIYECHSD